MKITSQPSFGGSNSVSEQQNRCLQTMYILHIITRSDPSSITAKMNLRPPINIVNSSTAPKNLLSSALFVREGGGTSIADPDTDTDNATNFLGEMVEMTTTPDYILRNHSEASATTVVSLTITPTLANFSLKYDRH